MNDLMNKKERDHQYIAYMCQVVQIKMLMIVMIIVVEKCVCSNFISWCTLCTCSLFMISQKENIILPCSYHRHKQMPLV